MEKGDHIRVKDGTADPDFKGRYLSGYTGHIEGINDKDNYVLIQWDDSTLKKFDAKFRKKCDKKQLDYRRMVLDLSEIELIEGK